MHASTVSEHACALTERQSQLLSPTLTAGTSRSDLHQGMEVAPLKIEPQSLEVVRLELRILPAPTTRSQPARAVFGRGSYHSKMDTRGLCTVSSSDKAEVYHQCACARLNLMVLSGHHSSLQTTAALQCRGPANSTNHCTLPKLTAVLTRQTLLQDRHM